MPPDCMTDEAWSIYRRVIQDSRAAGIRFAVGGGLAIGVYTSLWRETKDMDFYVVPEDRGRMQEILTRVGLVDYYEQLPYDRAWIYRSVNGKVIVDIIWSMANHKNDVDERWILGGPEVTIRGERIRLVPPEEMAWAKLYVLQRDRCDWPDVMNIIYAQRESLDWGHLLERLREDSALLHGVLVVFRWLSPAKARELPQWLWGELERSAWSGAEAVDACRHHADLLDRRPWFSPTMVC